MKIDPFLKAMTLDDPMLLSYMERAKLNTPVKANLSPNILLIRSYLDKFNAETIIATILMLLLTKQFVL